MTERNTEIPVACEVLNKSQIQYESATVELKKNTYFHQGNLHKPFRIFVLYQYFEKFIKT